MLRHPGHELVRGSVKTASANASEAQLYTERGVKLQLRVSLVRARTVSRAGAGVNNLLLLLLVLADIQGFNNEEGFLRCWDWPVVRVHVHVHTHTHSQQWTSTKKNFYSLPVKLCSLPCKWLYTAPSRCYVITLTEHVAIILPSLSKQKSENHQNCELVHSSLSPTDQNQFQCTDKHHHELVCKAITMWQLI